MPWKQSSVMEKRLRFVARRLGDEPMTELCREFGISRKTGYKVFDRYKNHGLKALTNRSRRSSDQLCGSQRSQAHSRNSPGGTTATIFTSSGA